MNLKKTIEHLKEDLFNKDRKVVENILNKFSKETTVEKATSSYPVHEKIIIISKLIDHFEHHYGYVPDWLYTHLVRLNQENNKNIISSFYH